MLSKIDIIKEIGKNIYLYPLHKESIKANSIDLHASSFGWSLKTKNPLKIEDGHLVIPANDTALIYTEEAVYVSNRIGGSYHSKVMYTLAGIGHIGTSLDAGYIGQSLIAFHNHNNNEFRLEIGHELVTIQFYYLHAENLENTQDASPGHPRFLSGYQTNDYYLWADKNTWIKDRKKLFDKMIESNEYKDIKTRRKMPSLYSGNGVQSKCRCCFY